MRHYEVKIIGESPLIMHWDNIDWSEQMKEWRENPENKKVSVAGDDRSPAQTWIGSMYHDGEHVTIPYENIMRCFMEGGTQVLVPGGKSGKTFKAQTQSGMMLLDLNWKLKLSGNLVPVEPLLALTKEKDFKKHEEAAKKAGFVLFVKRARIGQAKHVRVRPMFDKWAATGVVQVTDDQITTSALQDIVRIAGMYKGLGDWRPSSRTPGPFGRFRSEVKEIKIKI